MWGQLKKTMQIRQRYSGVENSLKFRTYPKEFFLLVISTLSIFLAYHMAQPILPLQLLELGANTLEIGAIIGSLSLVLTFSKLPSGIIAQRSAMTTGLAFSGIGQSVTQILYAVSPTYNWYYLAQVIHAITIAPMVSVGIASCQKMAPAGRRGEAMGFYLSAYGIAATIGPVVCSFLLLFLSYSQIFVVASLIPIAGTLPLILADRRIRFLPDVSGPERTVVEQMSAILHVRSLNILSLLRFLYAIIFGFFGAFFVVHAEVNLLILPSTITLMLGVMGAADLIVRFPLGRLLDRLDYKWMLVGSYGALGILYYVLSETRAPLALTALLFFIGLALGVRVTSEWVMLSDYSPEGARSITSGYLSTIDNTGRGLGAILGAYVVLATSISFVFKLATAILVMSTLLSLSVKAPNDVRMTE
jgi:predicted MFS family arabinose efflux permease